MHLTPPRNKPLSKSSSPNRLTTSRFSTTSRKQSQRSPKHLYTCQSIQQQIQHLHKQKQFIDQCLKIYESLLQSKIPQKCLLHNNSISLYCYKQKKLLCVNCMYMSNHHRNHRIVPVKQALVDIQKDNINRFGEVAGSLNWLDANQQVSKDNIQRLGKSRENITKVLEKDFDMFMREMSNKYLELKNGVLEEYRRAVSENEQIYGETKVIKLMIDESLEKIDNYKGGDDVEVVRHLFVENIIGSLKSIFKKPLEKVNTQSFEMVAKGELNRLRTHLQKHKWARIVGNN